ncbi:MAG: hypothetical protein ABSF29_08105 [Tepidisphaeraceae bacterium]|jgi:hypothetical protein
MVRIEGEIVRGYGWATRYLKIQIPLIAKQFPEIEVCHRGSINVLLDTPLRIDRPDFVTRRIDWGKMKEVFHFTRIEFELIGGRARARRHRAWIYGPQNSPHRTNPFYIEVIAPKIALGRARRCGIRIHRVGRRVPMTVIG